MTPLSFSVDTVGGQIGCDTPIEDAISALAQRGCPNLTLSIDPATFSDYPVAKGGYCDVYKGLLNNGTQIAVKSLRICAGPQTTADSGNRKVLKRATKEMYHWSKLQHRNVLPLLGLTIFRGYLAMVSEWAENGNLMTYRRRNPNMGWIRPCMDVCAGLCYIHAVGMVHGDLKAANVMVSSEGIAMITDFGNAQMKDLTLKFTNTTTTSGLSVRWAAPELLRDDSGPQMTKEADVYAYGMVVLEVITGSVPYEGISDNRVLALVAYEYKHPPRPDAGICDELWKILISCWNRDAPSRPEASIISNCLQAINHLSPQAATSSNTLSSCQTAQSDMMSELHNEVNVSGSLVEQHNEGVDVTLYSPRGLEVEKHNTGRHLAAASVDIVPKFESEQRPTPVSVSATSNGIYEIMGANLSEHNIGVPRQGVVHSETQNLPFESPMSLHQQRRHHAGDTPDVTTTGRVVGPCYYFVAPVYWYHDFPEHAIFCLNQNLKTVFSLDAHLSHHEYPLLGPACESLLQFQIGGLTYHWYTSSNTLGFVLDTSLSMPQLFPVILLDDLETAQATVQQLQEQSRHFDFTVPPNAGIITTTPEHLPSSACEEQLDAGLSADKAATTQQKTEMPMHAPCLDFAGERTAGSEACWERRDHVLQNAREACGALPSKIEPRSTPQHSTSSLSSRSTLPRLKKSSRATLLPRTPNGQSFGSNPKKEDIDSWVDRIFKLEAYPPARGVDAFKCPEAECSWSSCRPHALKAHLYYHYKIRPFKCQICGLAWLYKFNLRKHIKYTHICPGCPNLGLFLDAKAHRVTCPRVAKPVIRELRV